jgi:dsDNA-specific endonuclease/ATPase MutS2
MGKKKNRPAGPDRSGQPRRGKRRSIRFEAYEETPEERREAREPGAPPSIHLRLLKAEEALDRLDFQLRAYAAKNTREVLVVHGKGSNSPGGMSVLGPLVRQWCDDHPDLVLSWRIAPSAWGGEGAIVVTLNI